MFIFISWKNKKGVQLKTLVDHTKICAFVTAFIEHGVEPEIEIPELDKEALENQKILIN
jgi:hypothetical protein